MGRVGALSGEGRFLVGCVLGLRPKAARARPRAGRLPKVQGLNSELSSSQSTRLPTRPRPRTLGHTQPTKSHSRPRPRQPHLVQPPRPLLPLHPGARMPRPRQRRGADAKKEEKQAKREQAEAEARAVEAAEKRKRYTKSTMDMDVLRTSKPSGSAKASDDPNALPECDPDTKAYFVALSSQIDELQQLGHGSYGRQQGEGEEEEDDDDVPADERPLLLRSALESLAGHEVELAGDNDTSVILERLLHAMDDFARRVLLDRFAGQIHRLVCHRTASHVLQTLFTLSSETIDREVSATHHPDRWDTLTNVDCFCRRRVVLSPRVLRANRPHNSPR